MGQKWAATLKVEFEMQDGQPPIGQRMYYAGQ